MSIRLDSIFRQLRQLFGKLPDAEVGVIEELFLVASDKVGVSGDARPITLDKLLSVTRYNSVHKGFDDAVRKHGIMVNGTKF